MKIHQLVKPTRKVEVPFGEEKLTLTVASDKRTLALVDSLDEMNPAQIIQELVTEWDLEGEDGQPVPLTMDAMRLLPLDLLRPIARASLGMGTPDPE